MNRRTDELGRAFAGSRRQIQTYVNRRQPELDSAIRRAFPDLANAELEWVSPLESDRFVEYQDGDFLVAIGHPQLGSLLSSFWPSGGPRWDALARVRLSSSPDGVLLVEAKSYPAEMYSGGCRAEGRSRDLIAASLSQARKWYCASDAAGWMGPLYQFANRLAHLYFLRELAGIPAWFANVCFIGDSHRPAAEIDCQEALAAARSNLGLPEGKTQPSLTKTIVRTTREWRFLPDPAGGGQFLAFANAKGSSSMRCFDASSGALLRPPKYGRHSYFQEAFRFQIEASQPVAGPGAVALQTIPREELTSMRAQAGLGDPEPIDPRSTPRSLLSGVDDLIDRSLGVEAIGQSAPHHKHLTSYRHVAGSRLMDGIGMIGAAYTLIEQNWPGTRCRSSENWRWVKKLHISGQNESPEKRFEKAVAANCQEWFNMIPVASGVIPGLQEGGRRIDLARECEPGWFEFVELKFGPNCDTPLRAAIEILQYGLIYVFSRVHASGLGYDAGNRLLSARRISLKAVLPAEAYSSGSLERLEGSLNAGLRALTARLGVQCQLDFVFESLPAHASESDPCAAMRNRSAVYSAPK
ncbi:MAG: hypothetical protein HXY18_03410 [Bryobacteraceae bacterium]|nr:hypothetical protein [Bryobacteraceae bacterium]